MEQADDKICFTPDELDKTIKKAIKENAEHLKPSKRTLEEISGLKVCMSEFKIHLEYIKEKLEKNEEMMKGFIDSADKKFANKLTEKIVYGLVAVILTGFMGAIIALVLK